MRKFGSLLYKINTLLQKARQIVARANILFKHIINIFFPILGVLFAVSFWCYFQKLQLLLIKKKFEIIFDDCTSICVSSKSVSQISKILFQFGDINIFVLLVVSFSRYIQLKRSFSDENNISSEVWHIVQQRSYWKLAWHSINGKFLYWQKFELCKVVHNQGC